MNVNLGKGFGPLDFDENGKMFSLFPEDLPYVDDGFDGDSADFTVYVDAELVEAVCNAGLDFEEFLRAEADERKEMLEEAGVDTADFDLDFDKDVRERLEEEGYYDMEYDEEFDEDEDDEYDFEEDDDDEDEEDDEYEEDEDDIFDDPRYADGSLADGEDYDDEEDEDDYDDFDGDDPRNGHGGGDPFFGNMG